MFFQILVVLSYFVNGLDNCQNYTSNLCLFTFDQVSCSFASCFSPPLNETIHSGNWQACVSYCCSASNNTMPQTLQSLKELCPNSSVSEQELSVVEIGAIVAITIFVAVCIYCFIVKKYGKCCPCVKENTVIGEPVKNDISEIEVIKRFRTSSFCENDKSSITGKEEQTQEPNRLKFCSICLQNNPNVQTECGHLFHLTCLCCWNKRSKSCPDCRANLTIVKILCEKCFKSRIVLSLSMDRRQMRLCRKCSAQ